MLVEKFYKNYMSRREITYHLPFSANKEELWNEELEFRKSKSTKIPLHSWNGRPYFLCLRPDTVKLGDNIVSVSMDFIPPEAEILKYDSDILDEAFYSSLIEGAFSTKVIASELASGIRNPVDRSERMILNNYKALEFVRNNADAEINDDFLIETWRILTDGTLEEDAEIGYRKTGVQVVSSAQKVIYNAPEAKYIRQMMDELFAFCADEDVHPLLKSAVAQIYMLTVHPFCDGNGRTSRALSYKILLSSGYDIFRFIPVSGVLSDERKAYYKAIMESQNSENGYDFTYFTDFYLGMLSRAVDRAADKIKDEIIIKKARLILEGVPGKERMIKGISIMQDENSPEGMCAERWSKIFKVSGETARKDLLTMEDGGIVKSILKGKKKTYFIENL